MSTDKTKSGPLPSCAICRARVAVYRCPRCHTCTCSLECCRAHKEASEANDGVACSGKRDRTEFCSLARFTDSRLASDYHFLEDVLKVSEGSKRLYQGIVAGDSSKSASSSAAAKRARVAGSGSTAPGRLELDSISTQEPAHPLLRAREGKSVAEVLARGADDDDDGDDNMQLDDKRVVGQLLGNKPAAVPPPNKNGGKVDHLVRQAELKGVNLLRMPSGMERRRSNTTKFNRKKGIITWKVELCFHKPKDAPNDPDAPSTASASPALLKVESEVCESSTLLEELGKHLDVRPGNSTTRSQLRAFASEPRDSLLLFMKRLPCSSAAPQYFKLEPDVALVDLLKGKTVIEFPTIDVVVEKDKDRFPLFIGEVS